MYCVTLTYKETNKFKGDSLPFNVKKNTNQKFENGHLNRTTTGREF